MQIVIDIDDNLYTRLFDNGDEYVADMRRACVAIRKGTPLSDILGQIRAEIEKVFCISVITNELRTPMEVKTEILQIIDKYRGERSGKE